jgi:hypothetical protein
VKAKLLALALAAVATSATAGDATLIDPVFLDTIPLREARKLDGLRLYVVFTLDTPPVEYASETITGPEPPNDPTPRAVHFPARLAMPLQPGLGKRVRVYGTLRVIDYPARATAGVQPDTWSVIRVENATLARW